MRNLKALYAKDIERNIEGVIKVANEKDIKQELEEYVVTRELKRHFTTFFDIYKEGINSTTQAMGVWISGFFGSGKSHFLKMLSYLLDNKVVDGKQAVDYFNGKIDDEILLSDIKKAGNVSADVILFNIDSKSSSPNGKKDRILEVFERAFNEKIGLSTTPYVAEIERYIIEANKYEEFKDAFRKYSNKEWEEKRDALGFFNGKFAKAYSEVLGGTEEDAKGLIKERSDNYRTSIEGFAKLVRDYINKKGNNHHVVFLVDEVGQYIGEDGQLMLNLQTMVEDLGTYCNGKAWVVVTSQEAIDEVIDKIKGHDFSKIQARFKTRLSMSSSDIDEVIKKRILEKKDDVKEELKQLYKINEQTIENLFSFESGQTQTIYKNVQDFVDVYPFVSYQFGLLQKVFTKVRNQGYSGKSLSSGERSVLGAFQEVAKQYGNEKIETVIPFYAFYTSIERSVDNVITRVMNKTESLIENDKLEEMDLNVLKILFMIRNIKEIPSNISNIVTLIVSNIYADKIAIKEQVIKSLERLERETLIQKSNNEYFFLTDEEQDVNREIKNIRIDEKQIEKFYKEIIIDNDRIYKKFKYKNKPFNLEQYIDDTNYGFKNEDIGIKVILPGYDDNILMKSAREDKYVFVELEISNIISNDIENYIKTIEYLRSVNGEQQTPQRADIINRKKTEMDNVKKKLENNIKEQLDEAPIYVAGDKKEIKARSINSRLDEALEILINNIYNKLDYIKNNCSEKDIKILFNQPEQQIIGDETEFANQKAYDEIYNYCEEKNIRNEKITIRSLIQDFSKAPYGFIDYDILYLLTKLLKDEKLLLKYNNEEQRMTSSETLQKILKREYYDSTIVAIKTKTDYKLIEDLKALARDEFGRVNLRDDEDGMIEDFKKHLKEEELEKLKSLSINYLNDDKKYPYPGKSTVDVRTTLVKEIIAIKDREQFFERASDSREQFSKLDIKNIIGFFEGSQREMFNNARTIVEKYENNKEYIDKTDEMEELYCNIVVILKAKEPYSDIQKLRGLRKQLTDKLGDMYDIKSKPIIEYIEEVMGDIRNDVKINGIDEGFAKTYIDKCKLSINEIESSDELMKIFADKENIRLLKQRFDKALLDEISRRNEISVAKEDTEIKPIIRKTLKRDSLVSLMKKNYEVNKKEDIDEYLEDLKELLLNELEQNGQFTIR